MLCYHMAPCTDSSQNGGAFSLEVSFARSSPTSNDNCVMPLEESQDEP